MNAKDLHMVITGWPPHLTLQTYVLWSLVFRAFFAVFSDKQVSSNSKVLGILLYFETKWLAT